MKSPSQDIVFLWYYKEGDQILHYVSISSRGLQLLGLHLHWGLHGGKYYNNNTAHESSASKESSLKPCQYRQYGIKYQLQDFGFRK